MKHLIPSIVICLGLISASSANAGLVASADGQTVYDSDLHVTWLANANLAATNTFGVSGINANGTMTWYTAQSWIGAMNAANYLGYSDWRLPTITDTGTPGCNFSFSGTDCGYNVNTVTSEMAHLFYDELGNKSYFNTDGTGPQAGWGLTNTGPFNNLQSSYLWSGTEYAPDTRFALVFSFYHGGQGTTSNGDNLYALAVRPGQIAAVPVPGAMWLLGSGLIGLLGVARRKAA